LKRRGFNFNPTLTIQYRPAHICASCSSSYLFLEILKEKVAEFESFKDNLSKIDQEINEIKSRILAKRQELKKKHKKELDKLDSILSNLSILGWVGHTLRMRLTS
jgi:hypothetical protein